MKLWRTSPQVNQLRSKQLNFCCAAMPVHATIECAETSGDQRCAHGNEVASELTPKSTSILLSAKSLIKTVSAMGVAVPYQAEVKVTHWEVCFKTCFQPLLFLDIMTFTTLKTWFFIYISNVKFHFLMTSSETPAERLMLIWVSWGFSFVEGLLWDWSVSLRSGNGMNLSHMSLRDIWTKP